MDKMKHTRKKRVLKNEFKSYVLTIAFAFLVLVLIVLTVDMIRIQTVGKAFFGLNASRETPRPPPQQVSPYICTDSDNGLDYSVKGNAVVYLSRVDLHKNETSTTLRENRTDTCEDSTTLNEQFCSSGRATSSRYDCPYGCIDGACNTQDVTQVCGSSIPMNSSVCKYVAQVFFSPKGEETAYFKNVLLKRVPRSGCLENKYVVVSRKTSAGYKVPCMDNFFYNPKTSAEKFSLVSGYYYADYLQEYHREKMKLTLPKLGLYLTDPPASDPGSKQGHTVGLTGIEMYPTVPFLTDVLEHEFAHFVQHNIFSANHPGSCEDANSPVSALLEGHARYASAFFMNSPMQRGSGVSTIFNLSKTTAVQFPVPTRDKCEDTTACGNKLLHGIAGIFWEIKTLFEYKYNDADKVNLLIYTAWKEITFDKEPMTELLIALSHADSQLNNGENRLALAEIFVKRCPNCGIKITNDTITIPNYVPSSIPNCAPA
jgi:hypothetical protein